MSSIRTPDGASLTVTSSPGASSGNPSTSNPQATFETVAGANAVTIRSGSVMSGTAADGRQQILVEGAVEIVHRIEPPVGARGGIVHVQGPAVDDRLALLVHLERDGRLRTRPQH